MTLIQWRCSRPITILFDIDKTLRVTPAMAAGVSGRLWEVVDIVALLEATEAKPGKRGSYKKEAA